MRTVQHRLSFRVLCFVFVFLFTAATKVFQNLAEYVDSLKDALRIGASNCGWLWGPGVKRFSFANFSHPRIVACNCNEDWRHQTAFRL